MPLDRSKHQQMRNAIDAVELALNGLAVNHLVRAWEGADNNVMIKVRLGDIRQLARCYPELNRIINDPAFEKAAAEIDSLTSRYEGKIERLRTALEDLLGHWEKIPMWNAKEVNASVERARRTHSYTAVSEAENSLRSFSSARTSQVKP